MNRMLLVFMIVLSLALNASASLTVDFDLVPSSTIASDPANHTYGIDLIATVTGGSIDDDPRIVLEFNQNYTTLNAMQLASGVTGDIRNAVALIVPINYLIVVEPDSISEGTSTIASFELETENTGTYFYVNDYTSPVIFVGGTIMPLCVSVIDNDAFDSHGVCNYDAIKIASVPEPATMFLLGVGCLLLRKKR